jgi:hypothetical protein
MKSSVALDTTVARNPKLADVRVKRDVLILTRIEQTHKTTKLLRAVPNTHSKFVLQIASMSYDKLRSVCALFVSEPDTLSIHQA